MGAAFLAKLLTARRDVARESILVYEGGVWEGKGLGEGGIVRMQGEVI